MKTKNIFKTLAFAMLMPTLLLTTACSTDDDAVINNESTFKKGYALPVTLNVTRQGDSGTNRASYNGTDKKLEFSTGDKLLVKGNDNTDGGAGKFAGTLDWVSEGTFSGTIYTENSYSGTVDALLSAASWPNATLLPAGYKTYGFVSITNEGTYNAYASFNSSKAFALSKDVAVEQFSSETAYYSAGFALSPSYSILNFTITDLTPNTSDVAVSLTAGSATISGTVTTDGTGKATFAVAVGKYTESESIRLTVGGSPVALYLDGLQNIEFQVGKIYNSTRSAAPFTLNITSPAVGQVIGSDGKNYAYASLPSGVKVVARICYVSGGHGLALARGDGYSMTWSKATTAAAAQTPVISSGGTWKLATKDEWNSMITAAGGYSALKSSFSGVGCKDLKSSGYWTSTEKTTGTHAYYVHFGSEKVDSEDETWSYGVRACLEF